MFNFLFRIIQEAINTGDQCKNRNDPNRTSECIKTPQAYSGKQLAKT